MHSLTKIKIHFFLKKYFPFIVIFVFLTLSIILITRHEFWRDEIRAWHIGSESNSLSEFINNMSGDEGHPYFWSGILYFISHYITDNIEAMKVIHLAVSTITAFLFLKYSPFNKIIKVMCVFGYFMFYEYSIISRNYAFGVLFIIIFCILYKNKYKNIIPISAVLLLMGQQNIVSLVISIALILFVMFDFLKSLKEVKRSINKIQIIVAISIILVGFLFTYLQLGTFIAMGTNYSPSILNIFKKSFNEYKEIVIIMTQGIIRAYLPIPNINVGFWGSNIIVSVLSRYRFIYTFLFSLILYIIPIFILKRKIIFLYIAGTVGMSVIPFFSPEVVRLRHLGHFFILLVICIWISNLNEKDKYLINDCSNINKKIQDIFFIMVITASLIGSSIAFYYDFKYPFSNGKYVAQYIEENFDKDKIVIIGYQDYAAETVSGYLNKDIYYPNSKEFKKFVSWDNRMKEVSTKDIFNDAYSFIGKNDEVLILKYREPFNESEIPSQYYFKKLDIGANTAIEYTENYYLYLFNKDIFLSRNSGELMQEINCSNFTDLWCNLYQCEVFESEDDILLKINGNDPHFESDFPLEFKDNDPILAIIKIRSIVDANFQIYFKRVNQNYNEGDSIIFPISKGQNNIYLEIPYSKDLEKIRIDPINIKSDCCIEKMEFYN